MCNAFNRTLINEMLHCYMVTARCKLFKEAGTPDTPPMNGVTPTALPYPQYVGVDRKLTYHGIMTHRVLVTHDFLIVKICHLNTEHLTYETLFCPVIRWYDHVMRRTI